MPRLLQLMALGNDDQEMILRGVATDTMSNVAEAVGKDMFKVK